MGKQVCCIVVFMSPAECVRRIQAATPEEAEKMLCTLEAHARAAALEEAAKFCELYPSSLHVATHLRLLAEQTPNSRGGA